MMNCEQGGARGRRTTGEAGVVEGKPFSKRADAPCAPAVACAQGSLADATDARAQSRAGRGAQGAA
eukprot:5000346-Prymnesium_polylepis.1